jgi:hypothetical protein
MKIIFEKARDLKTEIFPKSVRFLPPGGGGT